MSKTLTSTEDVLFDIERIFEGTDHSMMEFDVNKLIDSAYLHNDDGTFTRVDADEYRAALTSSVWDSVNVHVTMGEEATGVYVVSVEGVTDDGSDFVVFGATAGNPETYVNEFDSEFVEWLGVKCSEHGYIVSDVGETGVGEYEAVVTMDSGPRVDMFNLSN